MIMIRILLLPLACALVVLAGDPDSDGGSPCRKRPLECDDVADHDTDSKRSHVAVQDSDGLATGPVRAGTASTSSIAALIHGLVSHTVRDDRVAITIRALIRRSPQGSGSPDLAVLGVHRHVLALYDRILDTDLTQDEIVQFTEWLIDLVPHPNVVADVVLVLPIADKYTDEFEAKLDRLRDQVEVKPLPQPLLAVMEEDLFKLGDDQDSSSHLLDHLIKIGQIDLLSNPDHLLSLLLRYRVRFDLIPFLSKVKLDAKQVPDVIGLLRIPSSANATDSLFYHLRRLIDDQENEPLAISLINVPRISWLLHSRRNQLVHLLLHAIDLDRAQLIADMMSQSYSGKIINGVRGGRPPICAAFVRRDPKIISCMLKVPSLDLRRTDPKTGQSALKGFPLYPALNELLNNLLLSDDQDLLMKFKSLLQDPLMTEFVNVPFLDNKMTLLSWSLFNSMFSVTDLILSLPSLRIKPTNDGPSPLSYLHRDQTYSLFTRISAQNLLTLLRTDYPIFFSKLLNLYRSKSFEILDNILKSSAVAEIITDPECDLLLWAFKTDLRFALKILTSLPNIDVMRRDSWFCVVPFWWFPAHQESMQIIEDELPIEKFGELILSDFYGFIDKLLYRAQQGPGADSAVKFLSGPRLAMTLEATLNKTSNTEWPKIEWPLNAIPIIGRALYLGLTEAAQRLIFELVNQLNVKSIDDLAGLSNMARSLDPVVATHIMNLAEDLFGIRQISSCFLT